MYVFASSRINFCVWRGASFILLFHICRYGSNCRCSPIFYLSCFWAHGRRSVPWSPWSWVCPCDLLWSKDNKQKNVYTFLMYWNWIWKMKRELAFSHGSWSITAERGEAFLGVSPCPLDCAQHPPPLCFRVLPWVTALQACLRQVIFSPLDLSLHPPPNIKANKTNPSQDAFSKEHY